MKNYFLRYFAIVELVCMLLLTAVAHAQDFRPNGDLTPGSVESTDIHAICQPGYSRAHRHVNASQKRAVRIAYGITESNRWRYTIDHLVPLELGGSNEPANLWPEPNWGFWSPRIKDRLENRLRYMVCHNQISLDTAQRKFRENWINAYSILFPWEASFAP